VLLGVERTRLNELVAQFALDRDNGPANQHVSSEIRQACNAVTALVEQMVLVSFSVPSSRNNGT
jgi:hypothetical protein